MRPDYTLRWDGRLYQIGRQAVVSGLRGADVRVGQRLDGSLAVRQGKFPRGLESAMIPSPQLRPSTPTKPRQKGTFLLCLDTPPHETSNTADFHI